MPRPQRAARARFAENGAYTEALSAVVHTDRGPISYTPRKGRGTDWKYVADPVGPDDTQRNIKLITEQNIMYVSPIESSQKVVAFVCLKLT